MEEHIQRTQIIAILKAGGGGTNVKEPLDEGGLTGKNSFTFGLKCVLRHAAVGRHSVPITHPEPVFVAAFLRRNND